jgi:hypothetical protein
MVVIKRLFALVVDPVARSLLYGKRRWSRRKKTGVHAAMPVRKKPISNT